MLVEGNGAPRRRAAFTRGCLPAVLAELADDTAQREAAVASGAAHRTGNG